MKVEFGSGKTEYGPGVSIELDGDEIAEAIGLWLHAQRCHVVGPRTISIQGVLSRDARASVYVDPSGFVVHKDVRWDGAGGALDRFSRSSDDPDATAKLHYVANIAIGLIVSLRKYNAQVAEGYEALLQKLERWNNG